MQVCSGATESSVVQQYSNQLKVNEGFLRKLKLDNVKPCKGSDTFKCMTSLRSHSSVSVAFQKVEASKYGFEDPCLREADPEIHSIIKQEKKRQSETLDLTPLRNYTSGAVMEAVGSCLTNKYSEGLPKNRYYGGNQYIDEIEILCQQRAMSAFHLDGQKWGVNVQPLDQNLANFEVYTALLSPHDSVLAITQPFQGFISKTYKTWEYQCDESTGFMDYENVEKIAIISRPKLIVVGAKSYPQKFDYPRLRKIADTVGAFLMMDMSHTSGPIAASIVNSPFEYCDVVTTATDISLRGPKGGVIFFRKEKVNGVDLGKSINNAVFPSVQGGPHNHTIAGIAICMKDVQSPSFKSYQHNVVANSKALSARLADLGYKVVPRGCDNLFNLVELFPLTLECAAVEILLNMALINVGQSILTGVKNTEVPRGILLGAHAMTTRGFANEDFIRAADLIHEGIQIALDANKVVQGPTANDFRNAFQSPDINNRILELRQKVELFTTSFPPPGI